MTDGEVIGTKVVTGQSLLLDCRFELPFGEYNSYFTQKHMIILDLLALIHIFRKQHIILIHTHNKRIVDFFLTLLSILN